MIPYEFSSQSPSYQAMVYPNSPSPLIPNMVSERYRFPPRWRNLPPLFFVIFDPTSYLMTHSILRHLLKLANMEKRFSPLPPLCKPNAECSPLPPHDSDVNVEEESDSVGDGKETTTSIQVLEYDTSRNRNSEFIFGNFRNSAPLSSTSITPFKPEIKGSTFKIGEITCFLNAFKPEDDSSSNSSRSDQKLQEEEIAAFLKSQVKVEEKLQKIEEQLDQTVLSKITVLENYHRAYIISSLQIDSSEATSSPIPSSIMHSFITLDLISSCSKLVNSTSTGKAVELCTHNCSTVVLSVSDLHVINTAIFDPGGAITDIYISAMIFSYLSNCISISSLGVVIFIFDPGGDRHCILLEVRTFVAFYTLRSELNNYLSSLNHELILSTSAVSTKLVDDAVVVRMRALPVELREKIEQFRGSVEVSLVATKNGLK